MKSVDLSVIILSYNTKQLLRECLESVVQSAKHIAQSEIIVVDNASKDGSVEMIKKYVKKYSHKFVSGTDRLPRSEAENVPLIREDSCAIAIRLIENRTNLGFAKGNNQGIKVAQGRYILFLNSDTEVFQDTFHKMVEYMDKNPEVGVATCKVVLANGNLDPACHRGFPTPWNAFTYFTGLERLFPHSKLVSGYHLGWLDKNTIHEIDTPTGAFFLIRREVVKQTKGFDERYFMYAEDIDWSYRIKKLGWKVMFVPITKIIHFKKRSGRAKKEAGKITPEVKKIREQTINHFFESMKLFYDTHYLDKYPEFIRKSILSGIWFLTKIKLLVNKILG